MSKPSTRRAVHHRGAAVWLLLRGECSATVHGNGTKSRRDCRGCSTSEWRVVFWNRGPGFQVYRAFLQSGLGAWRTRPRSEDSARSVVSCGHSAHGTQGAIQQVGTVVPVSHRGRETPQARRFTSLSTEASRSIGGDNGGGGDTGGRSLRSHPRPWRGERGAAHTTSSRSSSSWSCGRSVGGGRSGTPTGGSTRLRVPGGEAAGTSSSEHVSGESGSQPIPATNHVPKASGDSEDNGWRAGPFPAPTEENAETRDDAHSGGCRDGECRVGAVP